MKLLPSFLIAVGVSTALTGCSHSQWQSYVTPSQQKVADVLAAQTPQSSWVIEPANFPSITAPTNVRPCCAFGDMQKVSLGQVNVPFFRVNNVVDVDTLGPHKFASGIYHYTSQSSSLLNNSGGENNGILYTERGGFIDTAHIRDTADDTIGMFFEVLTHLGKPHRIELVDEIGPRYITLNEFATDDLTDKQKWDLAAHIAARMAYFKAESHEIAQWHGYASFAGFPEKPSAYSPEDLYSNMLGAKLSLYLIQSRKALTEKNYNQHLTLWIDASLRKLGAVDRQTTRQALATVDGQWWDSTVPLPNKFLLLKRHYELGDSQSPLLIPNHSLLFENQETSTPISLSLPSEIAGHQLDSIAQLTMEISDRYAATFEAFPESLWKSGFDHRTFKDIAAHAKLIDEQQLKSLAH